MVTALILLGFDIIHAIRTLIDYRPSRVVTLLAIVNGRIDQRTSIAYSSIEQLANAMKVNMSKIEVEVTKIDETVQTIRKTLSDLVGSPPVIIDIGGGMRILLLETILAYFSLPRSIRDYIRIVTYLEGMYDRGIELTSDYIRNLIIGPSTTISTMEKLILKTMVAGQRYRLGEIHTALLQQGVNVSKQYALKMLKKLIIKGIVSQVDHGYYVKVKDIE